jgi:hypothetical protein
MRFRAQIASYEVFCAPVIKGTQVLNSCDERTCCNPEHLFIGSYSDERMQYIRWKTNDSREWNLDTTGITSVKEMIANGKDTAHIALSLNIPIGVVKRIQLRGKQINIKE